MGDLLVELQVRTLAQHMWAATSHKLQYKREESVPLPLRRAIYRVSALLETVDLELDRVLTQRGAYVASEVESPTLDAPLNIDLANLIAREVLPAANDSGDVDGFDEVLQELYEFGIKTGNHCENYL